MELSDIREALCTPFDPRKVSVKPGMVNKFKPMATPLLFVGWREYVERLNDVAYGDWSSPAPYYFLNGGKIVCSGKVVICGVEFPGVGESELEGANGACEAFDQMFKRACSMAGLGAYLYNLKSGEVDYDKDTRRFLVHPLVLVSDLYVKNGIEVDDEILEEVNELRNQPVNSNKNLSKSGGGSGGGSASSDPDQLERIKGQLKQYNKVPDHILTQLDLNGAKEMQRRFIAKEDREDILKQYQSNPQGTYRRPWKN